MSRKLLHGTPYYTNSLGKTDCFMEMPCAWNALSADAISSNNRCKKLCWLGKQMIGPLSHAPLIVISGFAFCLIISAIICIVPIHPIRIAPIAESWRNTPLQSCIDFTEIVTLTDPELHLLSLCQSHVNASQ